MNKERIKGWVFGNLIVMSVLLVITQLVYQSTARVFYVGFIEAMYVEPPSQKLAKR